MSIFGRDARDPKDEVIAALTNERDYLREKVTELEKQLLALISTHAYRLVHGDPSEAQAAQPDKGKVADPISLRSVEYRPAISAADVESKFRQPKN